MSELTADVEFEVKEKHHPKLAGVMVPYLQPATAPSEMSTGERAAYEAVRELDDDIRGVDGAVPEDADVGDTLTAADILGGESDGGGGEGVTSHVSDGTIGDAIAQHDDPGHPDATTVEEVRMLLEWLQHDAEQWWPELMDNIERGDSRAVAEIGDLVIISTGEHDTTRERLADYEAMHETTLDDATVSVVSHVIHEVAREHSDHDWGVAYPLVVRKPDGTDGGQGYVEAVINALTSAGLSPGQAWAVYGVNVRDNSQSSWASRMGRSQQTVSEQLESARRKAGHLAVVS